MSTGSSSLFSDDIAPLTTNDCTWHRGHIASLWIGIVISVSTYSIGGLLVTQFGQNLIQALFTLLVSALLVLLAHYLAAEPGLRYRIHGPVLLRTCFGTLGARLPVLVNALICCNFLAIMALLGGMALHQVLVLLGPGWETLGSLGEVISFFLFMGLNLMIACRGQDTIKQLEVYVAPLLAIVSIGLLLWCIPRVDWSDLLNTPTRHTDPISWLRTLAVSAGAYCSLAFLCISDLSRYALNRREWRVGEAWGIVPTMVLFGGLGALFSAASESLMGQSSFDIVSFISGLDTPWLKIPALLIIILATLTTSVVTNMVIPNNGLQSSFPVHFRGYRGFLFVALLGTLMAGWELLRKLGVISSTYDFQAQFTQCFVVSASLLSAAGGVLLADYYLVRRQTLNVSSLYRLDEGCPRYNWAGLISFLLPSLLVLLSFWWEPLRGFNDYGWIINLFLGGATYILWVWIAGHKTVLDAPAKAINSLPK